MTSELIVDVNSQEISIAITEEKQLVEFQREKQTDTFSVGNIYLGRVKKIMPGLNACFVDVGSEKEAFLHYSDLGAQFYSIQKYLKQVTSDRKKNFPIAKASIMPEKKKEGNGDPNRLDGFKVSPYGLYETAGTLNHSWGFKYYDQKWITPEEVIARRNRLNGYGANYLLKVGPDALGRIPSFSREILLASKLEK